MDQPRCDTEYNTIGIFVMWDFTVWTHNRAHDSITPIIGGGSHTNTGQSAGKYLKVLAGWHMTPQGMLLSTSLLWREQTWLSQNKSP